MMPRADEKKRSIVGRILLAVAGVVLIYVSGYAATFWLSGRGTISVYAAVWMESTAYLPVQLYRFSGLPGHELVNDFRQSCFEAGLRSR